MNLTAIDSTTKQSAPVYATGQALNVNIAGQAAAAGGQASAPVQTIDGNLTPKGYQQITATSAAFALTPPAGARIALIQAEAQAIRWRDDGVAPTTTVGVNLLVGPLMEYDGTLTAFRGIATTAGAILNVSYYA